MPREVLFQTKVLRFLVVSIWVSILTESKEAICQTPASISIDHVPIVVKDLERAKSDFSNLGFTIRNGRLNKNSINNAHLKFADGSSLELITVSASKDDLAQFYIDFLKNGEGPAFISLRVEDAVQIEKLISAYDLTKTEGSYYIWYTFHKKHPLSYLFFIHYKQPVKDEAEQLQHTNTASGITSITLTKADFSEEIAFFNKLGNHVRSTTGNPNIEHIAIGTARLVLSLQQSPIHYQRAINALSIRVKNIGNVKETIPDEVTFTTSDSSSFTLSGEECHGLAITFVQN